MLALADECPLSCRDGGFIRRGHDEELDRVRELSSGGKQWIAEYQTHEVQRTGIAHLKVGFNKVFGYYIEVTHAHRDKVPDDYVRKMAFAGNQEHAIDHIESLVAAGVDSLSVFPLGAARSQTIKNFAADMDHYRR